MEPLLAEIRRTARRLLKSPGFVLTAVATLALGIGAATAIFALVNAILLRPLPYPDADRLVVLRHNAPGFEVVAGDQSDGTFAHYRAHNRVFTEAGASVENVVTLTDREDPERVPLALATPGVFSVLGVRPLLGRGFAAADGEPGAPVVALLSHELWVRRYGADPAIVGKTIEVNRSAREVVGVLPPGFGYPRAGTQLWFSYQVEPAGAGVRDLYLQSVARLKPGVTPEAAEADLQRLVRALPDAYPDATAELLRDAQFRAEVVPLKEAVVGEVRPALVILACTVAFVLLIAWANLANLVLVRAERRRPEVALERALGARDADLARRFLVESALVAAAGGGLGLALASLGISTRFGFDPAQLPRLGEVRLDAAAVVFALTLTALSGLVFGGVSLARAGRSDTAAALNGGLGRVAGSRRWQAAQRSLVAVQVALALALLVGSAVMVQSFWRLRAVDLGFDPERVLTLEVPLPARQYLAYADAARFHEELLAQVRAIPGVSAAEGVTGLPLTGRLESTRQAVTAEGHTPAPGELPPSVTFNAATPGYFAALGIPLLRGRTFRPGELRADETPVVVSQELARTLYGERDPLGRRLRLADRPQRGTFTIVGVAGNVHGESITGGVAKTLYFPVLGGAPEKFSPPIVPRELTLVVRTGLPPASVVASVRRAIRDLDPKVPVASVQTLDEVVAASTARTRMTMLLLMVAAATALFLGVIGIYGVVSYSVSQRTPDLGVRLALGATPGGVVRMVLRQGALVALAGIAAGVLAAHALTQLLRGLVYQVSPGDPLAVAAMSALLFTVAVGASYLPARRAGKIDPLRALKSR